MFETVLMVCTGNVCRSPMAEVLLAARLRAHGRLGVRVESAGIGALVGAPADPLAIELMRARGLDLRAHRGRQLGGQLVSAFELILVMDGSQQRAIEARYPTARGRVHRLGRVGGFDVPDPHRRGREAFVRAAALIERGLDEMAPLLVGPALKSRSA